MAVLYKDKAAWSERYGHNNASMFPFLRLLMQTNNGILFEQVPSCNSFGNMAYTDRMYELLSRGAINSDNSDDILKKWSDLRIGQGCFDMWSLQTYPIGGCTYLLRDGAKGMGLWRNMFLKAEWDFRAEAFKKATGIELSCWREPHELGRAIYQKVHRLLSEGCPLVADTKIIESHFYAEMPDLLTWQDGVMGEAGQHTGFTMDILKKMFNYTGEGSMPGFFLEGIKHLESDKFFTEDLAHGGYYLFFKGLMTEEEKNQALVSHPDYRVASAPEVCLYWFLRFVKNLELPHHTCHEECVDETHQARFLGFAGNDLCRNAFRIVTASVANDGSPVSVIPHGEYGFGLETEETVQNSDHKHTQPGYLMIRSLA